MTQPSPDDTQPVATNHTSKHRLPRWVFGALIIFTSVTLLGTIAFGVSTMQPPETTEEAPDQISVRIIRGNSEQQVQTSAGTVGELLDEQQITIAPEDAISNPPETPLTDGMSIFIQPARDVTVIIDGTEQTVRTPFTNPFDILEQAQIPLADTDRITVDGTPINAGELLFYPLPVDVIEIERDVTVTIVDQTGEITVTTHGETVSDALDAAGITLYLTDEVTPALSTELQTDMRIQITRANPVFIEVDDQIVETRVQGGTVGEALADANVSLGGLDYTVPDENTDVTTGMTIRVVRVGEQITSVDEPIPYETVYQANPELELDTQRVVQGGVEGVRRISERIRLEDGVETGREPAGEEVIQAPVNQVIEYGTKIVLRTVDTPDGPREYWRKLRVYATSYHPAALGGDNVTSIGETLRKGIIGADPDIIPYRTNLFVRGYGTGIMADTGGPRSSPYWIDLGYSDEDWRSWSSYVDVYLLTPVPDNIDYLLPTWRPLRGTSP